MKTIGVLTSGGDSQGMNAAIRAIVRTGLDEGFRIMGIYGGYKGLIDGNIKELFATDVSDRISRGGTFLKSARCLEFKEEAGILKAVETCKKFGIDGIVVIGGDGSFRGARDLTLHGIPCVAMPGTIDNDIVCSEYTIGFDTAVNIVVDLVDRLRDTSSSHNRCSVVQIMGKNAGWVTLEGGIATGATCILVPEVEFDFQRDIVDRIEAGKKLGKDSFIVMVSEGVFFNVKTNKNYQYIVDNDLDNPTKIAKAIEKATGVESRETILGQVQRGGSPTARDRIVATEMGNYCVNLLKKGISNRVVVMKDEKVVDYDIVEGLNMEKPFNIERLRMANSINI
ncbi:MAG: ATP-dependent 6-phosphofructokinase [Clostridiales bacterium]|nr:MAG: ATP-dependent 6-phosphofructokinase [Clostridiales bacterium]